MNDHSQPGIKAAVLTRVGVFGFHSLAVLFRQFVILACCIAVASPAYPDQVIIDVDSARRELRVLRDDQLLMELHPISVGRWGVSAEKIRGDGKTPLGEFRIAWIKPEGHFGPFLGIDYPSVARAKAGLAKNVIDQAEFDAIESAHARGRVPPQDTGLGGYLGIHGLGRGDAGIHHDLNWTMGCIAVTNEEMQRLLKWADVGTIVKIH